MRKYLIAVIFIAIAGIGLSYYLLPSKQEVASLRAHDAQYSGIIVDAEGRYNEGVRSAAVLNAMTDLRLSEGRGKEMLPDLQQFLTAQPNEMSVRQKLVLVYRAMDEERRFLSEMLIIIEQNQSEQNMQLLADAYNMNQQYDAQATTLRALIDMTGGERPEYFVDLAIILAIMDKDAESREVVSQLKQSHPDYKSYKLTRLIASTHVDAGQMEEAYEEAFNWIAVEVDPQQIAELTDLLNYGGRPDIAITLSQPHFQMADAHTPLMLSYINALINDDQSDKAYDILKQRYDETRLASDLYYPFLRLVLLREEEVLAYEIATNIDATIFDQEQALNLLELAYQLEGNEVLQQLIIVFDEPAYAEDKPILQAVIALYRRDVDEDAKIALALNAEMTDTERLRFGQACARNQKEACFENLVSRYPAFDAMTPNEFDEIITLYIAAERPEEIRSSVYETAERRSIETMLYSSTKLAAAMDESARVVTWLNRSGITASSLNLSQLYFIANDNNSTASAMPVAELLYNREPSERHREYLISAYILSGHDAKALPLLREARSEGDGMEDYYLAALTKLARADEAYRDELTDFVTPKLDDENISAGRKLQLVFTLINTGQTSKAKPYIDHYSKAEGGEWKTLYNQVYAVNTGPSKPAPTPITERSRDFRVAVARDPATSNKTKRMLAFSLINDGHREDAMNIFFDMAQTAGPDSKEIEELLYLWLPRLSEDQLGWLTLRTTNATSFTERAKWAEIIKQNVDDHALMQFVTQHPQMLEHPSVRVSYFAAMATHASEETNNQGMRQWIDATSDTHALRDYVEIATGNGFSEGALYALNRMHQLAPQDPWTLKRLAIANYGRADYSKAEENINAYMQANNATPTQLMSPQLQQRAGPSGGSLEVTYYKANLLRRQGNHDDAMYHFQQVTQMGPQQANSLSTQSMYYTSLMHLGHTQQARQGYLGLLNAYPADKNLLAEFLSALIENGHLEEAKSVASQYDTNAQASRQASTQPLLVDSPNVTAVSPHEGGQKIELKFDHDAPVPLMSAPAEQPGWVEGSQRGASSLLISAKPGYELRFTPVSNETVAIVASPAAAQTPQERMNMQAELRLQLLYARMELESGQVQQARKRIEAIRPYFKQDPQYLGFAANVENAAGNWPRALSLLEDAQHMTPENEDIQHLYTNIDNQYGQEIKLDHTWRSITDSNEHITTLSGRVRPTRQSELGMVLQNNEVDAQNIRRSQNGNVGDFDASEQRAELYGAYYLDNGDSLKASLFANNDVPGAGAYYGFNNMLGRSEVFVEYQRPYWDFIEAVVEETNRSRAGVKHAANLSGKTSASIEASVNDYNIAIDDGVTETVLVRANIVHRLREKNPTIAVGYGFDGEYLLDKKQRTDASGRSYNTFPLVRREIHMPSVIIADDLTDSTRAELVAGYAYDRFNDHGPQLNGRITQQLSDELEAEIRALYGLLANETSQNVTQVGGHLKYKF